jgi:dihydrofolate synthase/folylpolyglutamate synthase
MKIQDAMAFLENANQYGSVLGLQGIKTLLEGLGNPQDELKFVHMAGTNGKGSTGALIASVLATAGYRIGKYISPAVFSYGEKIQIITKNQNQYHEDILVSVEEDTPSYSIDYINDTDIVNYISKIKHVCENMVASDLPHPTIFEIETAMAMLHFQKEACDLVILEVGLGGRLDATNVIKNTECAVITSISMDHMNFLGTSLAQIASEKAGIIKHGINVVSYEQHREAAEVIRKVCKEKEAHLEEAAFNDIKIIEMDLQGTLFSYREYTDLKLSLLGKNQVRNAVVALHTISVLQSLGYKISEHDIRQGISIAKWSGRFEKISEHPLILIDGAHNEDGARALAENIRFYFSDKQIIYIMGVLADKDYRGILRHTAPYARKIITITPENVRGLSSSNLAEAAKEYCNNVISADTVEYAINLAKNEVKENELIVIFGSLSYLGEVYQIIIR